MHLSDPIHPVPVGVIENPSAEGRFALGLRRARGEGTAAAESAKSWPEHLARSPILAVPSVRREWLDAGLTLAGAVLGWMTPLLLKRVEAGPGCNFYEYGESILCPLFACFGAGLGLMCSVHLGASQRRGVANGQRKSAQ